MILTATYTKNLNLKLPDYADQADVGVLNDNFKKIDEFSGGGKVDEWLAEIKSDADAALAEIKADADAAIENIEKTGNDVLATIPADYTTTYNRAINSAVAIPDESALAASHELHAQRDYPLNVAVHGYTYQEGEGDLSPDNVRPIHGLDAARVHAGGKNLFDPASVNPTYCSTTQNGFNKTSGNVYTQDVFSGTAGNGIASISDRNPLLVSGEYTLQCTVAFELSSENTLLFISLVKLDGTLLRQIDFRSSLTFNIDEPCYLRFGCHARYSETGNVTFSNVQLEFGSTATPYEPYCANTINPPLLPDNSPLMEGDTVENWVRSGCDKSITFNSGDGWIQRMESGTTKPTFYRTDVFADLDFTKFNACGNSLLVFKAQRGLYEASGNEGLSFAQSDTYTPTYFSVTGITTLDELNAYLAANPLTVYYRSTDYTPDKDLRVCRVVRKTAKFTINGDTALVADVERPGVYYIYMSGYNPNVLPVADGLTPKNATTSNNGASNMNANECAFRYGTTDRFYIKMAEQTLEEALAVFAANPVNVVYTLATPEVYMSDPLPLLPPAALESETVTVTGSGETEVEYAHDTKHYIDSQIAAAVALALNG